MRHFLVGIVGAFSIGVLSPVSSAQEVNIRFAEDLQEEFAETYGEREKVILETELRKRILKAVEKDGLQLSRIDVIVEDASPNHPTREQASQTIGLDQFRSVSIGGAKITGESFDLDGNLVTATSSKLYSHSIRDARYATTWSDAKRAFSRFSRKMSKDVQNS